MPSLKLRILSDLHLEICPFALSRSERNTLEADEVVILAGDIAVGSWGMEWARKTFPQQEIIYVAGNHEFYSPLFLYEDAKDRLRQSAFRHGIHFLDKDVVEISGIRFLGCTLWTDFDLFGPERRLEVMDRARRALNDYRLIRTRANVSPTGLSLELTPELTKQEHLECVSWLDTELSKAVPEQTVVITHHAPHHQSVPERYRENLLSGAFASNLTNLVGRSALWIHGHMHDSFDYMVDGTRVVCNPRGYVRSSQEENEHFNCNKGVQI